MFDDISVQEVKEKIDKVDDVILLDVRTNDEHELVNIGGKHIPLSELEERYEELDKQKEVIIYCHHGGRSAGACEFLAERGFARLKNMVGGIDRWSLEIDLTKKRY